MKTKKLMEQAILFAINALSCDIKNFTSIDTERDAKTIKTLAEAYDIIHRGKRGEF